MFNIRTDLAIEVRELYKERENIEVEGVEVEKEEADDYDITRVKILNEIGSEKMGKPIGSYITIESQALKCIDEDLKDEISKVVAKELKALIKPTKKTKTLVVGLGNEYITPDALGPKVIEKIYVTRHFFKTYGKTEDETLSDVSAIAPGVMGVTGIETVETIKGIVEKTNPDLIVAVDALASRKTERLNTTIQITDTGISPGSGVGNIRKALNEEYLGVPVVAIGVPTVVDAATMINDTINLIIEEMEDETDRESEFYKLLGSLDHDSRYGYIKEVLSPSIYDLVVTPKEIDDIMTDFAHIIANGINISLHHGIDLKDVNRYLN